jgi:IS5 family transposase
MPGRSARAASTARPGFGCKAQVTDNDDGIILDYAVEYGAAPDGPQLAPAVERIARRAGQVPRAVTADRGYGLPAVERDLRELGIRTVAIPRQAATSQARKAAEHRRPFRQAGQVGLRPQPGQDQRPHRLTGATPRPPARPELSPPTFQVEVARPD